MEASMVCRAIKKTPGRSPGFEVPRRRDCSVTCHNRGISRPEVEEIVDADTCNVFLCVDAGIPGPSIGSPVESCAGRDVVERPQVDIEELGLGGPIRGKRPLAAAAGSPT